VALGAYRRGEKSRFINRRDASSPVKNHPHRIVEGPVYSAGWSRFFTIAALAVFLATAWFAWKAISQGYGAGAVQVWQTGLLGIGLFYVARRLGARSALKVLLADPRAPVLYLRSFNVDAVETISTLQQESALSVQESRLADYLNWMGPVVAIGRPGDRLAHLGAARLYVSDDSWQEVARRLMAAARLVVIRAGVGAGLKWELVCAREDLPPDKVVVWIHKDFRGAAYTAFRELARDALKIDLPEELGEGFLRFDSNWQPTGVIPLTDSTVLQGPQPAGPPASLRELFAELGIQETSPPRFRLHPVAWVIAAFWLMLVWARALWIFLTVSPEGRHVAVAAFETTTVALFALTLAFIFYLRKPVRRWLPSLLLCTVVVVHGSWLVARTLPDKAEVDSEFARLETTVCQKAFKCSPPADFNGLVANCVQGQMRDTPALHRLPMIYVHQKSLEKCESRDCDDFISCFTREAGLMTLPPNEKRQLLVLVCEAIQDTSGSGRAMSDPRTSLKWAKMEEALEKLDNPALADALLEEGRLSCAIAGNGKARGGGGGSRQ